MEFLSVEFSSDGSFCSYCLLKYPIYSPSPWYLIFRPTAQYFNPDIQFEQHSFSFHPGDIIDC